MLSHLSRRKEELKKRRIKRSLFSLIRELGTKKSTKLNLRLRESRRKKKEKFRDSESSRRRQPIDKLKSMPSEPKELLKREKDRLENVKDLSSRRDSVSLLILKLLGKSNLLRSNRVLLNRPELKEKTT
jgi:hypothetical protein